LNFQLKIKILIQIWRNVFSIIYCIKMIQFFNTWRSSKILTKKKWSWLQKLQKRKMYFKHVLFLVNPLKYPTKKILTNLKLKQVQMKKKNKKVIKAWIQIIYLYQLKISNLKMYLIRWCSSLFYLAIIISKLKSLKNQTC
jgi:hypothetical protein